MSPILSKVLCLSHTTPMLISLSTVSWQCQKQSNMGSVSLLFFKLFVACAKIESVKEKLTFCYRWSSARVDVPAQQE